MRFVRLLLVFMDSGSLAARVTTRTPGDERSSNARLISDTSKILCNNDHSNDGNPTNLTSVSQFLSERSVTPRWLHRFQSIFRFPFSFRFSVFSEIPASMLKEASVPICSRFSVAGTISRFALNCVFSLSNPLVRSLEWDYLSRITRCAIVAIIVVIVFAPVRQQTERYRATRRYN